MRVAGEACAEITGPELYDRFRLTLEQEVISFRVVFGRGLYRVYVGYVYGLFAPDVYVYVYILSVCLV